MTVCRVCRLGWWWGFVGGLPGWALAPFLLPSRFWLSRLVWFGLGVLSWCLAPSRSCSCLVWSCSLWLLRCSVFWPGLLRGLFPAPQFADLVLFDLSPILNFTDLRWACFMNSVDETFCLETFYCGFVISVEGCEFFLGELSCRNVFCLC